MNPQKYFPLKIDSWIIDVYLFSEEETDVASSGFEDSQSQAASQAAAERSRVHPTPGPTPTPRQLTPATASPCSIRQQQQQKPVYGKCVINSFCMVDSFCVYISSLSIYEFDQIF